MFTVFTPAHLIQQLLYHVLVPEKSVINLEGEREREREREKRERERERRDRKIDGVTTVCIGNSMHIQFFVQ